MALTPKATTATRLLLKSDKPGDDAKGAKCPPLISEEAVFPVLGSDSSLPPWPIGGLEGPVCTVKMGRRYGLGQSHLEVVGVLTSYESDFLKVVRRSSWEQGRLETFGICPAGEAHSALLSLKRISAHLTPELTDGLREMLRYHPGPLQARPLGTVLSHRMGGTRQGRVRVQRVAPVAHPFCSPGALLSLQALCLSRDTRYLLLRASLRPAAADFSLLQPLRSLPGSLLPPLEAQQLLFGADEKCFTRMTPALLLLVKPRCEADAPSPSSFLSVGGLVETVPYPQPRSAGQANASSPAPGSHDQFLGSLTRFVSRVLSPSGEPPAASGLHHWLDFKTMETLPHRLLNLSEQAALERLVQSDEPLVLLFPQNSQALLEQQFGHWRLEGSLLQRLLEKLQAVIQELREIPAFQANMDLFQHLLAFCYYPLGSGSGDPTELPHGHRKLRTLLLLKALQTVRAHWQEKRKVSRQNRSAGPQAYCRLQELTINLRYDFIIVPVEYTANNCEGPCRRPLSTRSPGYSSHTVLLLEMQARGTPLRRSPCCVPVKYSSQDVILFTGEGLQVTTYPEMVAEECGCR
uniref:Muellerian-inhibiting factor n=1 Tax=Terrapene triunguis TaxID=2587831 RepID=A0A674KF05_9SAUR